MKVKINYLKRDRALNLNITQVQRAKNGNILW